MMNPKEKVQKILALANDKAATAAERETALDLAKKLAAKYGMKIEHTQSASFSHSDKVASPDPKPAYRTESKVTHEADFKSYVRNPIMNFRFNDAKIANILFRIYILENDTVVGHKSSERCKNITYYAVCVNNAQSDMLNKFYEKINFAFKVAKKQYPSDLPVKFIYSDFYYNMRCGFESSIRLGDQKFKTSPAGLAYDVGYEFYKAIQNTK